MRRLSRLPALLGSFASLFVATPALALETSFHTYDGFAETVDAFRLVSMIFADPRYETLVLIVAVVGMALGAVLAMIRGTGMGLVAFGLQMLVGIGLFVGLVATTGTVHIYDRVRNTYQPVGDVPNLIVLVAGVTNMMERALADTIDDNTLDPHAKLEFGAGGHAFDLFLNAVSPRGAMTDAFLDATIKDYVRQCYPVARVSPAYGIDDDQLFRTSTDLLASFAAMAGPATFSTVFTTSDKGGTTVSCNEAWAHIADRLSDPAIFEAYSSQVCQRTGYDIAKADQIARCRSNLAVMGDMMLGTPLAQRATGREIDASLKFEKLRHASECRLLDPRRRAFQRIRDDLDADDRLSGHKPFAASTLENAQDIAADPLRGLDRASPFDFSERDQNHFARYLADWQVTKLGIDILFQP